MKIKNIVKVSLILLAFILVGCSNNEKKQESIDKLKGFADLNCDEDVCEFSFLNEGFAGEKSGWILRYTEESRSIRLYDQNLVEILKAIFGNDFFYSNENEYIAYNIGDKRAHVYLNEDLTGLSSITYDFEEEEFTAMQEGKHYYLSDELLEYLDNASYLDLIEQCLNEFESDLEENNLTLEEVSGLRLKDIE